MTTKKLAGASVVALGLLCLGTAAFSVPKQASAELKTLPENSTVNSYGVFAYDSDGDGVVDIRIDADDIQKINANNNAQAAELNAVQKMIDDSKILSDVKEGGGS